MRYLYLTPDHQIAVVPSLMERMKRTGHFRYFANSGRDTLGKYLRSKDPELTEILDFITTEVVAAYWYLLMVTPEENEFTDFWDELIECWTEAMSRASGQGAEGWPVSLG